MGVINLLIEKKSDFIVRKDKMDDSQITNDLIEARLFFESLDFHKVTRPDEGKLNNSIAYRRNFTKTTIIVIFVSMRKKNQIFSSLNVYTREDPDNKLAYSDVAKWEYNSGFSKIQNIIEYIKKIKSREVIDEILGN